MTRVYDGAALALEAAEDYQRRRAEHRPVLSPRRHPGDIPLTLEVVVEAARPDDHFFRYPHNSRSRYDAPRFSWALTPAAAAAPLPVEAAARVAEIVAQVVSDVADTPGVLLTEVTGTARWANAHITRSGSEDVFLTGPVVSRW